MARPAKFDCQDVLCKAMTLFWEKGYRAVSVADLVKVTGLQPGSLYGRFGNKEGLFVECLAHYGEWVNGLRDALPQEVTPLNRLRALYEVLVNQALGPEGTRGCFYVNTCLEADPQEPEICAELHKGLTTGERWIRAQLEAAISAGELKSATDAKVLAGCLSTSLYGLRVVTRAGTDADHLRTVAMTAYESLVGPWQTEAVAQN
ncbi:TetR/AcrR family transcriptional regulator [Actomonas aquatica]|uniref:TetR/AcrR family transcriptional regulator n=1 Tax=Actomonas aquatica TaxID=2866162 RepID=A0ABZ1C668_9BACT|nr:TetR/AcrR family transcriptional regulator [Opitutus sp. WL0086]WRQ85800.1 TetR/AcrR family transcriptional regulator [Opitutus sp. WL0086]